MSYGTSLEHFKIIEYEDNRIIPYRLFKPESVKE